MSMSLILIAQLLVADTPATPAEEPSPPTAPEATPASSAEPSTDPPATPREASAPPAGADAKATSPAPQREPARQWYGWQTLLVDVGTSAFILSPASFAFPFVPLFVFSLYILAPTAIHAYLHARPEVAMGDFLLRLVLPIVGVVLALPHFELFSPSPPAFWAPLVIGWLAPSLIDAAVLAWEPVPDGVGQRASGSARWAPMVGAVRGAPVVGLGGTF